VKEEDDEPTPRAPKGVDPGATPKGSTKKDEAAAKKKISAEDHARVKAVGDKILAGGEGLTHDDVATLDAHAEKNMDAEQLKELAAAAKSRISGTKAQLAERIIAYAKGKAAGGTAVAPEAKPDIQNVIANSPRAAAALKAVTEAQATYVAAKTTSDNLVEELRPLREKFNALGKALLDEHGLDLTDSAAWSDPRAAEWDTFRREVYAPARRADSDAYSALREASQGGMAALVESLKPATPQKIDSSLDPNAHGGTRDTYPRGYEPIEGEELSRAELVFEAASTWVQSVTSGIDGAKVVYGKEKNGRAWCANKSQHYPGQAGADYVVLISTVPGKGDGDRQQQETAVHEMGHLVEFHKPGVQALANKFVEYRCKGEQPVQMSEAVPNSGYGAHELGRKDDFEKSFGSKSAYYVGKTYASGATEVVSMGMELLYKDPARFAAADPEYFQFICHVLTM